MKPGLQIIEGEYAIHRFPGGSAIPAQVMDSAFFTVSRTDAELSIVCPSVLNLNSHRSESGWRCFKVLGPLDFSLTGILADLSGVLAAAGISIFAISTFDTDYILVKAQALEPAETALKKAGYSFPGRSDDGQIDDPCG